MAHRVKCYYCGITFDRDKVVDCVKVNGSRYAHLECHLKAQDEKTQEEIVKLVDRLMNLEEISPEYKETYNILDQRIAELFSLTAKEQELICNGKSI